MHFLNIRMNNSLITNSDSVKYSNKSFFTEVWCNRKEEDTTPIQLKVQYYCSMFTVLNYF